MTKKISFVILLAFLLMLSSIGITKSVATAETLDIQVITNPFKPWTITFSNTVSTDSKNLDTVVVQSASKINHRVSIKVSADSSKVIVETEKPYLFGNTYKLIIPKKFVSEKGNELQAEKVKFFRITGEKIQTISATANPFVTNIIVKGDSSISRVSFALKNGQEEFLIRNGQQFSKGLQGLSREDLLTIRAYDSTNLLIETQYYEVN